MSPVSFTVTQVRTAAMCPRVFYFDTKRNPPSATLLWKSSKGRGTAAGSLFHQCISKFNKAARNDLELRALFAGTGAEDILPGRVLELIYRKYVAHEALFKKKGDEQSAFMKVLRGYSGELSEIISDAVKRQKPITEILEELFGDNRRILNVTFPVGQNNEPIHLRGELDYVFYDRRASSIRIIDYKVNPSNHTKQDNFQVTIYGLMHDQQHQTKPSVAVLYLYPDRAMNEIPWNVVEKSRSKVHDLLESMSAWTRYDEASGVGMKPPGDVLYCDVCPWNKNGQCEMRLGPKEEGGRVIGGSVVHSSQNPFEPMIEPTTLKSRSKRTTRKEKETSAESHLHPSSNVAAENMAASNVGKAIELVRDFIEPPERSLWLGSTKDTTVAIPPDALATHVAVVGAAGSGKTWMAKIIAEEAILAGIPVLAIDPQGDLVQFLREANRDCDPGAKERKERFWKKVEPRVFTPGTSHGIKMCLHPMRLAQESDLAGIEDPKRRSEEWESILVAAANGLVSLAQAGGEEDSQSAFILNILKPLMKNSGRGELNLSDVVAGIVAPENLGIEDPDIFIRSAERQKLARKLNNIQYGTAAQLFSGGFRLDLDRMSAPATDPTKTPLNVVYLNALPDDDQKQFFVASLAAEIYRWMLTSPSSGGKVKLLVYLDEAKDYIPAGGSKPPAKPPLIRLFSQGRKYGVGCLICTQSPRSVDYNVFSNCSTKIIGKLESSQDIDRVREWFALDKVNPAWLGGRKGAAAGTFAGRWPEIDEATAGKEFKSRSLYSLHEGAWSPERVEAEMQGNEVRSHFAE